MKSMFHLRFVLSAIVLSAALSAFAQAKPDEQRPQRPGERLAEVVRRDGPTPGGGGLNVFFNILTEEQRQSFREVFEGQREKTRDLEKKLRDARKAVIEASVAEKVDEDVIRKKYMEMAKLDAELAVLRAKALSQVKPPLSKEQIEKIKNPQPFDGGGRRAGDRPEPAKPIEPGRDKNDLPPAPTPK